MRFRRVKRRARPWWLGCALSIVAGAAVAHAETVIPWDEAEKHVGEDVLVEGRVLGVRCSQLSCLLAFDPTLNRFTAVVQAANFKDLPPEKLEQLYSGKQVRVRGKVTQSERKPAAAAAVQASQAPPAPASYGEPQPRPAYEALRTVKRGMSATDVQRLVGDPTSVESSGGGWTT